MGVKLGGIVVAIVMLAVLAAGLWLQVAKPRRVVATGTIRIGGAAKATLRTRTVLVGGVRLQEVELPGGTWLDCGGDCERAAREATPPEFWRALERRSGGH